MKGLSLSIRDYRDEDLETLCAIDRVCFAEDIAFSRAEIKAQVKDPRSVTRVAEGPDAIAGFVMARLENPSHAHVLTLDVIPEFRRKRVGLSLMNDLHDILGRKRVRLAFLEVSVHNLAAQRLYDKLNYLYVETLYGYYRGREDAYLLVRVLEDYP